MLHNAMRKHNIVLQKEHRLYILFRLAWNQCLAFKLKIHKLIHGISTPIVHYYAVCWNEERMLPFVFSHYGPIVGQYTFYDNNSTDSSNEIIGKHPNTHTIKFTTQGFDDTIHNTIKNNCWKRSRGKADWVVVCDTDEFLYHTDLKQALHDLTKQGITLVRPVGYNMYSIHDPERGVPLTEQVRRGLRDLWFDKCILFNPHAVVEINYDPGAHVCHPTGRIVTYCRDDIKLLHYKNIGIDHLLARTRLYAQRLSKKNIENNYGTFYLDDEEKIIQEFTDNEQRATEII